MSVSEIDYLLRVQDIEKKYPGFVSMKAMQGFRLSYRLQTMIQSSNPTRGFRQKQGEIPGALNSFLYSTMRGTKQQRRAVAISLLRQYDEMAVSSSDTALTKVHTSRSFDGYLGVLMIVVIVISTTTTV